MPPQLDDVVSPELALVDPELAARARAALPAPVAARRVPAPRVAEPVPAPAPRHRRRFTTPALTVVATAAASLIVTAFTGPEPASGDLAGVEATAEPAEATAAAASPPVSSPSPPAVRTKPLVNAESQAAQVARPHGSGVVGRTAASPKISRRRAPRAERPAPRVPTAATTLVWPRSAAASSYDLELVRAGSVIYATRLRSPQVVLPRSWARDGVTYTIQPEDQAFVWPVVDGRRAARPLVNGALALDMTLVIRFAEQGRP